MVQVCRHSVIPYPHYLLILDDGFHQRSRNFLSASSKPSLKDSKINWQRNPGEGYKNWISNTRRDAFTKIKLFSTNFLATCSVSTMTWINNVHGYLFPVWGLGSCPGWWFVRSWRGRRTWVPRGHRYPPRRSVFCWTQSSRWVAAAGWGCLQSSC